jgi:DNA-binding MarR family transcriptional regulator
MTIVEKADLVNTVFSRSGKMNKLSLKILFMAYLQEANFLVHEMADELGVTAPAVSRCLDKLEEQDYAKRRRDDKTDRRKVRIIITRKGINFVEKLVET